MGNDAPFLLLLPAAGAYWLLTRSWQFCYRLRHERTGLIAYQVILSGTVLLALALLVNAALAWALPVKHDVSTELFADIAAPAIRRDNAAFAAICLLALGLGLVAPWILNGVARLRRRNRLTYYLRANRDDPFEKQWYLAHRARGFRLLQFTLDTKKIYIGAIAECPAPEAGTRRSVEIFPLASGYRHSETQELVLTTNYVEAHRLVENDGSVAARFEVVIRADRIVSSSPFDFATYEHFLQTSSSSSASRQASAN